MDQKILDALEEAYTFITQPRRMESPGRDGGGPTVLTYETHRYNEITAKLREAKRLAER